MGYTGVLLSKDGVGEVPMNNIIERIKVPKPMRPLKMFSSVPPYLPNYPHRLYQVLPQRFNGPGALIFYEEVP